MPTFRQPRAALPEQHDRLAPGRQSEISVMPIERFMVPGELEPVSHYCHVVRAGDFIYLSGMVGMKANGIIPPDTVGQFEIALKSIYTCLRHAGGKPNQGIKGLVFITD